MTSRRRTSGRRRTAAAPPSVARRTDRVGLAQVGDVRCAVERVDVPGVPPVRAGRGAAAAGCPRPRRDHLPVGAQVEHRRDQAAAVDVDPEQAVVEHDRRRRSASDATAGRGRSAVVAAPRSERGHAVQRACGRGVERDSASAPSPASALARRRSRSASSPSATRAYVASRLAVHPGDRACRAGCRGTGAAAPSPEPLQLVVRVVDQPADGRGGRTTARPRAAGARCAGCPASSGPGVV